MFKLQKYLYWRGINSANQPVHGYIDITDPTLAEQILIKQNIKLQSLKSHFKIIRKAKINNLFYITFYRQLATLLRAGVPIMQAFVLIANTQKPFIKKILLSIKISIEIGNTFYQSLQSYHYYFDYFALALLHIGETSGTLDNILDHLAEHYEQKKNLRDKFQQACVYPIILFIGAILLITIMLIFVVPQFAEMFADFNTPLPTFTLAMISLSAIFKKYYYLGFVLLGLFFVLKKYYDHSQSFQIKLLTMGMKVPSFQNIMQTYFSAKFAHPLGLMLHAGIPLPTTFTLLNNLSKNYKWKLIITKLETNIHQGFSFSHSLAESDLFTPFLLQMVKVGEESGTLSDMLNKIAALHYAELLHFAKQITQLFEPLIILILGVLIGGLVISLYLPIFKLGAVI